MKLIGTALILIFSIGAARADCTDEIHKPRKPHDVARMDWTAAGRKWQVALFWTTEWGGENGEEKAIVILAVRDNLRHPILGDARNYYLAPNRCDKPIDPSVSAVRLMGLDFLLPLLVRL